MAGLIARLAQWACALTAADLPPSVASRTRLQLLGLAGAVKAARGALAANEPGDARLVTAAHPREAARLHAALAHGYDDALFVGGSGAAAAAAAWACATDQDAAGVTESGVTESGVTVSRVTGSSLLCAMVAANEVSGRVAASMLLGGGAPMTAAAVAAAVAAGRMRGLDPGQMAHALALALCSAAELPDAVRFGPGAPWAAGAAAVAGFDAVNLAAGGAAGALDALDAADGVLAARTGAPLRGAFTGLSRAWLTDTLTYKLMPGALPIHAPVQATLEILRRHVRAANKRLRVDQIEQIDVLATAPTVELERRSARHGGLDPAAICGSVSRAIGVAAVAQELGPEQLTRGWLERERERIFAVARRVTVRHDPSRSRALVTLLVQAAGPLLAGVQPEEAWPVISRLLGGGPTLEAARERLRLRPLLARLQYQSGDLGDARLDEWQPRLSASVRVHTTRGGAWPEEREVPEGAPGWPWEETVAGVERKFAGSGGDAPPNFEGSARELVKGLLGSD